MQSHITAPTPLTNLLHKPFDLYPMLQQQGLGPTQAPGDNDRMHTGTKSIFFPLLARSTVG